MQTNGQRIRRPPGVKRIRRRDNQTTRQYLEMLEDERGFFEDRIEKGSAPGRENWDKQKAAAVRWALKCCREWVAADPLMDVVVYGTPIEYKPLQEFVDCMGGWMRMDGRAYELVGVRFVSKDPTAVRLTLLPLQPWQEPQRGVELFLGDGVKFREPTLDEVRQ